MTELWSMSDVEELWILIQSFHVVFSEILSFRSCVGVYLNIVVILHFYSAVSQTYSWQGGKKMSAIKAWFSIGCWEVISSQPNHSIARNKTSTWFLFWLGPLNSPFFLWAGLGSFKSIFFKKCQLTWKMLTQTIVI